MPEKRGATSKALDPLRAEFDRMAGRCRALREELGRQAEERRQLTRERDGLLAELARRTATAKAPDAGDATLLRQRLQSCERGRDAAAAELTQARERHAAIEAELAAARDDLLVGEEERACLEEQIRSLARALALLTAENRLLRQERRAVGGGERPDQVP